MDNLKGYKEAQAVYDAQTPNYADGDGVEYDFSPLFDEFEADQDVVDALKKTYHKTDDLTVDTLDAYLIASFEALFDEWTSDDYDDLEISLAAHIDDLLGDIKSCQ